MKLGIDWKNLVCVVVVAFGTCGWLLWLNWLDPGYFRLDDNANLFLTNHYFNWKVVREFGVVPQINFYQFGGNEQLGQGQSAVLYPPAYLAQELSYRLFGYPWRGVELLVGAHLVLGVVGMWVWLNSLKVNRWLAVGVAWVYISLPYVAGTTRSWVIMSYLIGYGPWIFWQLDKLILSKRWRGWGYVWFFSLLVYTGYIHWLVTIGFVGFWYMVISWWWEARNMRKLGLLVVRWMVMNVVVAGVAAAQLIPVAIQVSKSVHRASAVSYAGFVSYSMSWGELLGAQVFLFAENIMNYLDGHVYFLGLVGVLPVIGWWFGRNQLQGKMLGKYALLTGLAVLISTELFGVFYVVPGMNTIRWPMKNFSLVVVFASVAFGLGVNVWWRRGWKKWARFMVLVALVSNLIVLWQFSGASAAFTLSRPKVPIEIEKVKGYLDQPKRVLTYRAEDYFPTDKSVYLGFNYASVYGVFQMSGYDPVVSEINKSFAMGMYGVGSFEAKLSPDLLDYFSLKGVGYVVTSCRSQGVGELVELGLDYLGSIDGCAEVYENSKALPLVYLTSDLNEGLDFEIKGNRMVVRVGEQKPDDSLVFNVAGLGEFEVFTDGLRLPKRVGLQGVVVELPEDGGVVELVYETPGFKLGLMVSTVTILVWIGAMWFSRFDVEK